MMLSFYVDAVDVDMPVESISSDNIIITITIPASTEVKAKEKKKRKRVIKRKKGPILGSEGWLNAWRNLWKIIRPKDAKFLGRLCEKKGIPTFIAEVPTFEEMIRNFYDLKSYVERSSDPVKAFTASEFKGLKVLLERYKKPITERIGKKRFSELYNFFSDLYIASKRRLGKLKIVRVRNLKLPNGSDTIQIILEASKKEGQEQ